MKAIIIDDEPIAREGIRLLAQNVPSLAILSEFGNPLMAQEFIFSHKDLDIIFLDVEMPGLTGIEYLKAMPPHCHVILTTAYPQYAIEAFELNVTDYLLKPIRLERFLKAVNRVKELRELEKHELEINTQEEHIYIKSDRKFIKLSLSQITYIKGLKDYVIIHTADAKYMTAMNVGTIHRQLPEETFARVSKSYIINVNFVKSIDVDSIDLAGHEIPLGNSYKESFLSRFVKKNLIKR